MGVPRNSAFPLTGQSKGAKRAPTKPTTRRAAERTSLFPRTKPTRLGSKRTGARVRSTDTY